MPCSVHYLRYGTMVVPSTTTHRGNPAPEPLTITSSSQRRRRGFYRKPRNLSIIANRLLCICWFHLSERVALPPASSSRNRYIYSWFSSEKRNVKMFRPLRRTPLTIYIYILYIIPATVQGVTYDIYIHTRKCMILLLATRWCCYRPHNLALG